MPTTVALDSVDRYVFVYHVSDLSLDEQGTVGALRTRLNEDRPEDAGDRLGIAAELTQHLLVDDRPLEEIYEFSVNDMLAIIQAAYDPQETHHDD